MSKIEPVSIQLKTGQSIELRSCEPKDAEQLPAFLTKIASESTHTLQYPGKEISVDGAKKRWQQALEIEGWVYLGAFDGDKLVGQMIFQRESPDHPWVKLNADFAMFILKDFWGSGVADAMMNRSFEILKGWGIKRLEATVRTKNERGIAFYKRHGFEIEGIRKSSAEIHGVREDSYYIAKLF